MKKISILLLSIAILSLFVSACSTTKTTTRTTNAPTGAAMEKTDSDSPAMEKTDAMMEKGDSMEKSNMAPSFSATTIDGTSVSLDGFKSSGKPTVIYFMASWCPQCAKNWKALNTVYPKYKDDVNFVAISIDPTDTDDVLTKLAVDRGFVFDSVAGNPDIAKAFNVKMQTAKFGIDSNGNIVKTHDGVLSESEWDAFFGGLL